MNYDDREVNRDKSRQDREDRGGIARIAAGSRRDREDRGGIAILGIARIAAGSFEMGLQLFFISRLFMVQFANGFQQDDGNTLLSTVLVSYMAQIYFIFSPC